MSQFPPPQASLEGTGSPPIVPPLGIPGQPPSGGAPQGNLPPIGEPPVDAAPSVNPAKHEVRDALRGNLSGQLTPTITRVDVENPPASQPSNPFSTPWEIYAIHGLASDINAWTWKGPGGFNWLKHVSDDLQRKQGSPVSTFVVGWSTSFIQRSNISSSILDSARPLADLIVRRRGETVELGLLNEKSKQNNHLEQKPPPAKVIIIGHSMGGILAQALIGFMHQERNNDYATFLRSIAGVILLASPSLGSSLAPIGAPILQGAAALSGRFGSPVNWQHLAALKPDSPELERITKMFDLYCAWFYSQFNRRLPVNAFRETEKTTKLGFISFLVVSPDSANIPESTQPWVDGQVQDLRGLDHTQVTEYPTLEDPNLQLILNAVLRMQILTQQSVGGPPGGPVGGPPGGPTKTAAQPIASSSNTPASRSGAPQAPRGTGFPPEQGGVFPLPQQARNIAKGLQRGGQAAPLF